MTIAELRGKISGTGTNLSERMEDLLTSDTFGCMRYLSAEKVMMPFLNTAQSFHGKSFLLPDKFVKVYYAFWPWLKSRDRIPCEPDLVIGLETEENSIHLVMVEAKYYSGLSSEEDERPEPNDQLARELDNLDITSCVTLGWPPQLNIASRTLLFVTQDMGMPRELLAQSLSEYRRKRNKDSDIFWTSWRVLPSILEQILKKETLPENAAVLEDMIGILLKKGLIMFQGIEPITEYFNISDFYHIAVSQYIWPDIHKFLDLNYKYEGINDE